MILGPALPSRQAACPDVFTDAALREYWQRQHSITLPDRLDGFVYVQLPSVPRPLLYPRCAVLRCAMPRSAPSAEARGIAETLQRTVQRVVFRSRSELQRLFVPGPSAGGTSGPQPLPTFVPASALGPPVPLFRIAKDFATAAAVLKATATGPDAPDPARDPASGSPQRRQAPTAAAQLPAFLTVQISAARPKAPAAAPPDTDQSQGRPTPAPARLLRPDFKRKPRQTLGLPPPPTPQRTSVLQPERAGDARAPHALHGPRKRGGSEAPRAVRRPAAPGPPDGPGPQPARVGPSQAPRAHAVRHERPKGRGLAPAETAPERRHAPPHRPRRDIDPGPGPAPTPPPVSSPAIQPAADGAHSSCPSAPAGGRRSTAKRPKSVRDRPAPTALCGSTVTTAPNTACTVPDPASTVFAAAASAAPKTQLRTADTSHAPHPKKLPEAHAPLPARPCSTASEGGKAPGGTKRRKASKEGDIRAKRTRVNPLCDTTLLAQFLEGL